MPTPEGYGAWSHVELLLAALVDGVTVLAWQQTQIHGGKQTPPPDPIRRPGVAPKPEASISPAGLTYLSELRERRRLRGDPGR